MNLGFIGDSWLVIWCIIVVFFFNEFKFWVWLIFVLNVNEIMLFILLLCYLLWGVMFVIFIIFVKGDNVIIWCLLVFCVGWLEKGFYGRMKWI